MNQPLAHSATEVELSCRIFFFFAGGHNMDVGKDIRENIWFWFSEKNFFSQLSLSCSSMRDSDSQGRKKIYIWKKGKQQCQNVNKDTKWTKNCLSHWQDCNQEEKSEGQANMSSIRAWGNSFFLNPTWQCSAPSWLCPLIHKQPCSCRLRMPMSFAISQSLVS